MGTSIGEDKAVKVRRSVRGAGTREDSRDLLPMSRQCDTMCTAALCPSNDRDDVQRHARSPARSEAAREPQRERACRETREMKKMRRVAHTLSLFAYKNTKSHPNAPSL